MEETVDALMEREITIPPLDLDELYEERTDAVDERDRNEGWEDLIRNTDWQAKVAPLIDFNQKPSDEFLSRKEHQLA